MKAAIEKFIDTRVPVRVRNNQLVARTAHFVERHPRVALTAGIVGVLVAIVIVPLTIPALFGGAGVKLKNRFRPRAA